MAENQNAAPDALNPDEVVDIKLDEIPEDGSASPEKVLALKKGIQTLTAQKIHWRKEAIDPTTGKKFKDLAAERTSITPSQITTETPRGNEIPDLVKDVASLKQVEEKRQFGHEHNLSPEETDRVFIFAQGAGKKPAEVLTDPFIKSGLASMRSASRTSSATPRPSSRSPIVEGKQFHELSEADRSKNWGKVTGRE